MGRAGGPECAFEQCARLRDSMAEVQTRQLQLPGKVAHVVARGGQHMHPAGGQILGPSLREIVPIAHDEPVPHPVREGPEQFAIIDHGSGESNPAPASRFSALHVQLTAILPAHPGLRRARPGPQGAMLTYPGDVTDGDRRGILRHDGIRALGLLIAVQQEGQ